MIKINELYIRVHTATDIMEFREEFSSCMNIITSYSNTKGKSTIGESILFCLGLEEILGHKNKKAVKPVLRSKIEYHGKEYDVVQSDIFLEVENNLGEINTLKRSPLSNERNTKLVSVFNTKLVNVLNDSCEFEDYYVHDPGAAKNIRGFHKYLQSFIGLELPEVATYDGKSTKLYIQTLASCFYIEQKKGWMNVLATLPTYYRIKDVKKRVLEFIMGLSVLETERRYNICKARLRDTENEWELVIKNIISRVKKLQGITIQGIKKNPHVIDEEEMYHLKIDIDEEEEKELDKYLEELRTQINELNNKKEPTIGNRSEALNRELNDLDELFKKFSIQKKDVQQNYLLEKEQLESIIHRLDNVNKDLSEYKDLNKLIKLGSLEDVSIAKSQCPTCGQVVDETLFEQNDKLKIMNIEESIVHLKSEKKMLEFSKDAQQINVNSQKELLSKIEDRISNITKRIRVVKSDLISNNKAISQSHIHKIVELEMEINKLDLLLSDVSEMWNELKSIGEQWKEDKAALAEIPSDFITEQDREILRMLKSKFKELLEVFKFESTNIESIQINDYNYLPTVKGFDLQSDSSASDTIRIIWAYITAIQYVANRYGNSLGFLVFDEPAQQNTDLSSAKELLKELIKLSNEQQIFVFYKLESDDIFKGLNENDYKRIHTEDYLIKKHTKGK